MNFVVTGYDILKSLELSVEQDRFVETKREHRKIGKTKSLIEFAKKNDFCVIFGSVNTARIAKKRFGYEKIVSIDFIGDGMDEYVFDECCDYKKILGLEEKGLFIITGFKKSDNFYD